MANISRTKPEGILDGVELGVADGLELGELLLLFGGGSPRHSHGVGGPVGCTSYKIKTQKVNMNVGNDMNINSVILISSLQKLLVAWKD